MAPTHVLVIPTMHVETLQDLQADAVGLVGRMIAVARQVAVSEGLDSGGYRLVINTGADAGQSVYHLHMHLLGGRRMNWPPG